ncbi:MAG TPA: hypothetical protein VF666_16910 [Pyrinomonadaceae bacterium]|jgi:hypothetical protein
MNPKTASTLSIVLGTLGVLFLMAMAFGVFAFKYAIFLGVACFILAGMVKRLGGREY